MPPASTSSFRTIILRKFLEKYISPSSKFKVYTDKIPPTGRIAFVQLQPGGGLDLEGLEDNPAFYVQCRGAENNYEDAENIAREVDDIILRYGDRPFEIDGVQVWLIGRTGGGPQQINVEDKANRFVFSCNYYAKVSTNIGEDFR